MPTEVIYTVHSLAGICKKFKGIVFMDRHGNILNGPTLSDNNIASCETTGVADNAGNSDITATSHHDIITGVADDYAHYEITGVADNAGNSELIATAGHRDMDENAEFPDNAHIMHDKNYNNTLQNNSHVANDGYTLSDDNTGMYVDPTTLEAYEDNDITTSNREIAMELDAVNTHDTSSNNHTHGYNLRQRPTKSKTMYSLLNVQQQSTNMTMHKLHAHVLMMQMSIIAGIKHFGNKGNEALMKELQQLHE